jgi:hypothetical protein
MSHVAPASSHRTHSKLAQLAAQIRRSWNEAGVLDRKLMEMRTNLSRHSG